MKSKEELMNEQEVEERAPLLKINRMVREPLCSLEEADKNFEDLYLDRSHVKLRLTESTQILTPDGETKFLFLKNAIPAALVASAWDTLQKLRFRPSKDSRRKALRGSGGGELLLGWIEFPRRGRGKEPMLTSDTKSQWPEFHALWPLLQFIQYSFWRYLPDSADKQIAKAKTANEPLVDHAFRAFLSDATFYPDREFHYQSYKQLEKENPEAFYQWYLQLLANQSPEYFEKLMEAAGAAQNSVNCHTLPGVKDGKAMTGYTVPGTMFSTVTVNQTALFRSHADRNNLAGAFGCLAAFGNFSGGELCFPRFGISCPFEPGDLLIGDTNREQHGNIGPLAGTRISVVVYMRSDLGSKSDGHHPRLRTKTRSPKAERRSLANNGSDSVKRSPETHSTKALHLYIPSAGRAASQRTYNFLPASWRANATIVVDPEELDSYRQHNPDADIVASPERMMIGRKRQWIMDALCQGNYCALVDDDFEFYVRRTDDPTKFLSATESDINDMFETLQQMLSPEFPLGGFCIRQGANRHTEEIAHNTRIHGIAAWHAPTFKRLNLRYDRLEAMEDLDVNLQLLRAGENNFMLCKWAFGQASSNTDGGCSTYRTPALQAEAAHGLAKLHPGFVRVVTKETKWEGFDEPRTDVVCYWKKALAEGQQRIAPQEALADA